MLFQYLLELHNKWLFLAYLQVYYFASKMFEVISKNVMGYAWTHFISRSVKCLMVFIDLIHLSYRRSLWKFIINFWIFRKIKKLWQDSTSFIFFTISYAWVDQVISLLFLNLLVISNNVEIKKTNISNVYILTYSFLIISKSEKMNTKNIQINGNIFNKRNASTRTYVI